MPKRLNSTAVPPGRWDTVEFHRIGSKWHFITGLSSLVTRHSSLVTRHSSVLTWHSSLILRKEKIDFNWTIFWTKKEDIKIFVNTVEYHRIGTKWTFYYRPLGTNGLSFKFHKNPISRTGVINPLVTRGL